MRLESVGLSCEIWPECYGQISLIHERSVVPKTWAGVIHRLSASLLGFIVLGLLYMAIRGRGAQGSGILAPLLVSGLTVFLAILGYNTPSPDLPLVTLGNLLAGMAMLALLWWISQRSLLVDEVENYTGKSIKPWAILGLIILIVQISLGAWTSANFAATACPNLIGCNGDWASLASLGDGFDVSRRLSMNEQGRVVAGNIQSMIHMTHKISALLTLLYLLALAVTALRLSKKFYSTSIAIIVFLVAQVLLGITSVLAAFPLLVVTAHNATAALLLLAVVNLIHLLTPRITQSI
jgi:cytochrome c oxidase assembly protein subunit 15